MNEDFVTDVLPALHVAETAMRNGDPGPRIGQWTAYDCASWLGPFGTRATGRRRVLEHFTAVAARFADCGDLEIEVVAAESSVQLAHLVVLERATWSIDHHEPAALTMRVSRTYRREDGTWRIAYGHADLDPTTLSLPWAPPRRSS